MRALEKMKNWLRQDGSYRSITNCCLILSLFMVLVPQLEPKLLDIATLIAVLCGLVSTYLYFTSSDRALKIAGDKKAPVSSNVDLENRDFHTDEATAGAEEQLAQQMLKSYKSTVHGISVPQRLWIGSDSSHGAWLKKIDDNTIGHFIPKMNNQPIDQEALISTLLARKSGYDPIVFMVGSVQIAISDEETTIVVTAASPEKVNFSMPLGRTSSPTLH